MPGSQRGQSLVEVIIATLVGILVVSALTFATIFSLRNATLAKTSAQATKLAQEGIERVRTGRDRNSAITNDFRIGGNEISSWNGDSLGSGALWDNPIDGNCGNTNPAPPASPTFCYFNVDSAGSLQSLGVDVSPPAGAEKIGSLSRVVILSDEETSYTTQKKVTVIVAWTDFTGPHESKLVTILGKL